MNDFLFHKHFNRIQAVGFMFFGASLAAGFNAWLSGIALSLCIMGFINPAQTNHS